MSMLNVKVYVDLIDTFLPFNDRYENWRDTGARQSLKERWEDVKSNEPEKFFSSVPYGESQRKLWAELNEAFGAKNITIILYILDINKPIFYIH